MGSSPWKLGVLVDELDQRDDLVALDRLGELRVVRADVLERALDDLLVGRAAHDLAALAGDLPGHGGCHGAIVGAERFPYVGAKVGARLEGTAQTHVQLCGRLAVELRGVRIDHRLPSRQGRALFAYLVLQRPRTAGRDELTEAIWAGAAPAKALTVLLSKLRAVLGPDVLDGRGQVRIALPPGARVDV